MNTYHVYKVKDNSVIWTGWNVHSLMEFLLALSHYNQQNMESIIYRMDDFFICCYDGIQWLSLDATYGQVQTYYRFFLSNFMDELIVCCDCDYYFQYTLKNKAYFHKRKWFRPRKCKLCIKNIREADEMAKIVA